MDGEDGRKRNLGQRVGHSPQDPEQRKQGYFNRAYHLVLGGISSSLPPQHAAVERTARIPPHSPGS